MARSSNHGADACDKQQLVGGDATDDISNQCLDAAAATAATAPAWLDVPHLKHQQTALLGLLQACLAKLEAAAVPCWITGGTLLGALRHGGFVPHDDDVDLECHEADLSKIEAAFQDHPLLVFRQGGRWNLTPVAHVGLRPALGEGAVEVELDIFLREEQLLEHRDFPSAAEVFPLRHIDFHGLKVPAPGDSEPFLRRLYGEDWHSNVRVWSHDFNPFHSLAHDPDRVSVSLQLYGDQVTSAGYQPPSLLATDAEESLRALLGDSGALAAVKAAREETWLEKLQRRNREHTAARSKLKGS